MQRAATLLAMIAGNFGFAVLLVLGVSSLWSLGPSVAQQSGQRTFRSAEQAGRALFFGNSGKR
jgi:hypothetical protein